MRAEAVIGVPKEVQKQLEKLKVGRILCQLPPQLITDLLPYSGKFSRVLILLFSWINFVPQKLKPPNFYPHGLCARIANFSHTTVSQTAGVGVRWRSRWLC